MKILIAILIFSFIIIFHEFGHYIVARYCDVKVKEFQLGLGPRLFGIQKGETLFSLHLLPFGGACVMEGEEEASEDARAFNKKTVWQRMAIVFAGPFFNFILAFLLSVIIIGVMGYDKPVLAGVSEGYPAEEAGLSAGDEIYALNHYRVRFFREIQIYLFFHPGEKITVTYLSEGASQKQSVDITPVLDEASGRYLLGVQGESGYTKGNALTTIAYGFYEIKYQIYTTFESLKGLLTRTIAVTEMSGPVGIVKVIGDTYDASAPSGLLYIMMNMLSISVLLSANLGVMNLLPIPALDGGRILIFLVEVVRRKKMNEELEAKINLVGFAILMALMVAVLFNDIYKIIA